MLIKIGCFPKPESNNTESVPNDHRRLLKQKFVYLSLSFAFNDIFNPQFNDSVFLEMLTL